MAEIDTSFYGGRRGASFIIAKSYESIAAMIADFGTDNCSVGYDEYVMISPSNTNDTDNGKLYRRGYSSNSLNGAIYIGQIVGPSGSASHIKLTTIDNINKFSSSDITDSGSGSYSLDNNSLVAGKTEDNSGKIIYNDQIKWSYCTVKDTDNNNSIAYIGFTIPYTVFEFNAELVDSVEEENVFKRDNTNSRPFYEKWNLKIPKGSRGNSIQNLRVIVADNNIEYYEDQQDDILNSREVLVYDYYDYAAGGDKKTIYLGPYNMINPNSGITLANDGTLTIKYTYEDTVTYKLKWIDKVQIKDDGNFEITYNDGTKFTQKMLYPTKVTFDSGDKEGNGDQTFKVAYNDGTTETISTPINYIMKTKVTDDNHLLFLYSDPARRTEVVNSGKAYPKEIDGYSDWEDMGSIKDNSGLYIQYNLNPNDYNGQLNTNAGIISYLNTEYPNGIDGKIISIGDESSTKSLYAFDYTLKNGAYVGWYYVGSPSSSSGVLVGPDDSDNITTQFQSMPIGSVWFITEE